MRAGRATRPRTPAHPPRLAVAIVAYRSDAVLPSCLEALETAVLAAGSAIAARPAVCVVDNAGTLETLPKLADVLDVRLVRRDDNPGFSPAVNQAEAALPDSDLLLLLNPDARLQRDALGPLLEAMTDNETAIAGPLLVDAAGQPRGVSERPFHSLVHEFRRQLLPCLPIPPYGKRARETGEARAVTGACLLIDRQFFRAQGGLDEAIRMYLEDVDLCWRTHEAGRKVRFVAGARVVHGLGESSGGENFHVTMPLYLTLLGARVEFVRRRHGAQAALAMRAIMAMGAALRGAIFAFSGNKARALRAASVLSWAVRSGRAPTWDRVRSTS